MELRQSCYFGNLYDENEKWLLSPHAFAHTYHIVDLDNAPIHPQGQRGIVPAGTAFVIHEIEFPAGMALARRMLTTPRFNPWVYLKPAVGEGADRTRPWYIMLLPMDLDDEEKVEKAMGELFAKKGEVSAWMGQRSPAVAVAIRNKDVATGMREDELVAAMGRPLRTFWEPADGADVFWYGDREAWLVGGTVTAVKVGRAVDMGKAAAAPTSAAPAAERPRVDPSEPMPASTGSP